jgi:hypothetical protein
MPAVQDDIVYNNDQVKYFTRIREFKYERPNAYQSVPKILPQTVIALPLPVNLPNDAYQAIVREMNLGEIGSSFEVVSNLNSASYGEMIGAGATTAAIASIVGAALGAGQAVGDMLGASALLQPILGYGGAYAGYARNPRTAMIFDNMGMRHFNLSFSLSPRDERQSAALERALLVLRNQMHPELYNQFVLRYPSMFSVEFVNLNSIGVPKIDYSFLKGLSINASPQGQVFYKNGRPSIYQIDMEFVEIDMKTRNSFTGTSVGRIGTPPGTGGPGPDF